VIKLKKEVKFGLAGPVWHKSQASKFTHQSTFRSIMILMTKMSCFSLNQSRYLFEGYCIEWQYRHSGWSSRDEIPSNRNCRNCEGLHGKV